MIENEYTYDKDGISFRKVRGSIWKWLRKGIVFVVATMSMTVLYYVVFAMFFT